MEIQQPDDNFLEKSVFKSNTKNFKQKYKLEVMN